MHLFKLTRQSVGLVKRSARLSVYQRSRWPKSAPHRCRWHLSACRSSRGTAALRGSDQGAVHFSELPLDRAAHLRTQPERIEQLLASPSTLLLPLQKGHALVGRASLLQQSSPTDSTGTDIQLSLSLGSGRQLPLQPVSFAPQGASVTRDSNSAQTAATAADTPGTASTSGPAQTALTSSYAATAASQWVPLVVPLSAEALQGSPAVHAALDPSMDSSMGFVFLGLAPQGRAVFAFELRESATVVLHHGGREQAPSQAGGSISAEGDPAPPPRPKSRQQHGSEQRAVPGGAAAGPAAGQPSAGSVDLSWHWGDVRRVGQKMSGPDAAVLALASGLAKWHSSAAFCTRTGRPLAAVHAGHGRAVLSPAPQPSTAASTGKPVSAAPSAPGRVRAVYPRIDPAVIVAAACGDWLLLGRKKAWEQGRYSLLAGFCELGETLEQAAVREVVEESGVVLDPHSLVYHSSQPWPFPSSLMLGFVGHAALPPGMEHSYPLQWLTEFGRAAAQNVGLTPAEVKRYILPIPPAVQVDEEELEDARWFHRDYLLAALSPPPSPSQPHPQAASGGTPLPPAQTSPRYHPQIPPGDGVRIPGKYALAHRIIWGWLSGEEAGDGPLGGQGPGIPGGRAAAPSPAGVETGGGAAGVTSAVQGGSGSGSSRGQDPLPLLDLIPDVSIDEGIFKYVLLRVTETSPLHPPASPVPPPPSQPQAGTCTPGTSGSDANGGSSSDGEGCVGALVVRPGESVEVTRAVAAGQGMGAGAGQGTWAGAAESPGLAPTAQVSPALEKVCSKLVVRGDARAPYHDDIRRTAASEVGSLSCQALPGSRLGVETLGGGRIEHYPEQRLISIYGYSSAFGQAPHELTAAILRRWFPFHEIVVSYEGY